MTHSVHDLANQSYTWIWQACENLGLDRCMNQEKNSESCTKFRRNTLYLILVVATKISCVLFLFHIQLSENMTSFQREMFHKRNYSHELHNQLKLLRWCFYPFPSRMIHCNFTGSESTRLQASADVSGHSYGSLFPANRYIFVTGAGSVRIPPEYVLGAPTPTHPLRVCSIRWFFVQPGPRRGII